MACSTAKGWTGHSGMRSGSSLLVGVLGLCLTVSLSGCSSKKEASAANFEPLINEALKDTKVCRGLSFMAREDINMFVGALPPNIAAQVRAGLPSNRIKIIERRTGTEYGHKPDPAAAAFFQALRSGGLIIGDLYSWRPKSIFGALPVEVAILNEQALRYYVEETIRNPYEPPHVMRQLCYAGQRVAKIVRWSEPAENFGYKVTSVEYTVEPTNVADWAKPLTASGDQKLKTRQLVLTNDGWSADLSLIRR